MLLRRFVCGVLAILAFAAAGCTSDEASDEPDEPLPDGPRLVADAGEAAAGIESARFTIGVNGEIPGMAVRSLDGEINRSGEAQGTGTLSQAGQLVEIEFVLTGDTFYLKGPTGGYQPVPSAVSSTVYDPSAVLDPERGIAKLVSSLQRPTTEAKEDVDGTEAYKVTGRLDREVLSGLLPGVPSAADTSFWVRADEGHLPVKATASFEGDATVDVGLSEVDEPVTVTPPA